MDEASAGGASGTGTFRIDAADETPAPPPALLLRCPHCLTRSPLAENAPASDISCPSCGSRLNLVADDPLDRMAVGEEGEAAAGQRLGRFQLLQRLGAGGFGTVWKARDPQLDRIVALKIPHRGRLGRDETEKFLREARAAAQLRHPNIVSVHEVGLEDERLYIVSDFIEGLPLSDWLAEQRPGYRQSADLCIKIAAGLQHAHEAGVIHRDLKPGNIMIDGQGEPHIMDFGLAKRAAGEMTMTMEGQILGTPAYMSPEQAKGQAHAADSRTDLYALGVMLFELLTGERPFRGSVQMLLKQVIEDEPPSPRKFDGRVPRDLETICLKCMQKEPSRRYGSAKAVGEELQHYLAGEPIAARPVGHLERAVRWCRRKPLVAGLAATAILGLVFGLAASSIGYVRTSRALRDTRAAQAQMRQAIDDLFTRVSEDRLLREPGMQRLRADLLQRARTYYEKFLEQSGTTEDMREVALAHYRLGRITEEIETPEKALASYRQAEAMQRQLLAADANDVERMEALADTLNAMGCVLDRDRQPDEATKAFEDAVEFRRRMVALAPEKCEFKRMLANTYMNIGLAEKARDPAAARQSLELAQVTRREALSAARDDPKLRRDLAMGCFNLAKQAGSDKDYRAVRQHIHEAQKLFRELLQEDAAHNVRPDLVMQYQLATCYRIEADAICDSIFASKKLRKVSPQELQQLAGALEPYGEAIKIVEPLANKNPDVDEYQAALAEVHLRIGQIEHLQGHTDAAVLALTRAHSTLQRLLATHPEDPRCLNAFINTLGDLAAIGRDAAQQRQAILTLEELQRRIQGMATRKPPVPGASRLLPLVQDAMAQVQAAAKSPSPKP